MGEKFLHQTVDLLVVEFLFGRHGRELDKKKNKWVLKQLLQLKKNAALAPGDAAGAGEFHDMGDHKSNAFDSWKKRQKDEWLEDLRWRSKGCLSI